MKDEIKLLGLFYKFFLIAFFCVWVIDVSIIDITPFSYWFFPVCMVLQGLQLILWSKNIYVDHLANLNMVVVVAMMQYMLFMVPQDFHVIVFWMGMSPIIATSTCKKQASYFWVILSLLLIVTNGLYIHANTPVYDVEVEPLKFVVIGVNFLIILIFTNLIHNSSRDKQRDRLDVKNVRLLEQKRELVSLNQKLRVQHNELKHTQSQLIRSEKMASIGVLTAGIGHEINNPLQFIKAGVDGLVRELKEEGHDLSSVNGYIQAVDEGVTRASGIVRSLSHFSRQSTKMDEQCKLHNILDNCLSMLMNRIKYKAEVIKQYDEIDLVVIGNEGKLHQAFLNILANAEQSIQKNGVIKVWTKLEGKKIKVGIKDNGGGISSYHMSKIHDPFFTTKEPGVGTGLGLAITYQIIEEHHGLVDVKSKLNEGTEFVMSFISQ
ncbi:MAG: ATP-binding protein [Reichenbachiella sp.]